MDEDFLIINGDNIIEKSVLVNLVNFTEEDIFFLHLSRVKYGDDDMKILFNDDKNILIIIIMCCSIFGKKGNFSINFEKSLSHRDPNDSGLIFNVLYWYISYTIYLNNFHQEN